MLLGLSLLLGNMLSSCWNKQAALFCVLGSSEIYLLSPHLGRWQHTKTSCLWHTVTSFSYSVCCYKPPPFLPDSGKVEIVTGFNLKGCTERVREVYLLDKITWCFCKSMRNRKRHLLIWPVSQPPAQPEDNCVNRRWTSVHFQEQMFTDTFCFSPSLRK